MDHLVPREAEYNNYGQGLSIYDIHAKAGRGEGCQDKKYEIATMYLWARTVTSAYMQRRPKTNRNVDVAYAISYDGRVPNPMPPRASMHGTWMELKQRREAGGGRRREARGSSGAVGA